MTVHRPGSDTKEEMVVPLPQFLKHSPIVVQHWLKQGYYMCW